jgi:hypothetical protein
MDPIVKTLLNKFFIDNYPTVYKSTPELKQEGDDYFYTTNKDSDIICLMPLEMVLGT